MMRREKDVLKEVCALVFRETKRWKNRSYTRHFADIVNEWLYIKS